MVGIVVLGRPQRIPPLLADRVWFFLLFLGPRANSARSRQGFFCFFLQFPAPILIAFKYRQNSRFSPNFDRPRLPFALILRFYLNFDLLRAYFAYIMIFRPTFDSSHLHFALTSKIPPRIPTARFRIAILFLNPLELRPLSYGFRSYLRGLSEISTARLWISLLFLRSRPKLRPIAI